MKAGPAWETHLHLLQETMHAAPTDQVCCPFSTQAGLCGSRPVTCRALEAGFVLLSGHVCLPKGVCC
jgi:hypothetical protein